MHVNEAISARNTTKNLNLLIRLNREYKNSFCAFFDLFLDCELVVCFYLGFRRRPHHFLQHNDIESIQTDFELPGGSLEGEHCACRREICEDFQ